jgi:hypothetical protein
VCQHLTQQPLLLLLLLSYRKVQAQAVWVALSQPACHHPTPPLLLLPLLLLLPHCKLQAQTALAALTTASPPSTNHPASALLLLLRLLLRLQCKLQAQTALAALSIVSLRAAPLGLHPSPAAKTRPLRSKTQNPGTPPSA